MLEVFNKVICFFIMFGTGFFVIKKIIDGNYKSSQKTYLYILLLGIIAIFLYPVQYTTIYTITIFLLNIVVYKSIFKIDLGQAIIATSLFMVTLTTSDMLVTTIFRIFWTQEQIRTDFYISIAANLSIGIIAYF